MSFYNVWQPSSHTGSALTALTTRLLFHLFDFFLVGLWGNVLFYFPRVAGNDLYFSCSSVIMNELTWRFAVCVSVSMLWLSSGSQTHKISGRVQKNIQWCDSSCGDLDSLHGRRFSLTLRLSSTTRMNFDRLLTFTIIFTTSVKANARWRLMLQDEIHFHWGQRCQTCRSTITRCWREGRRE